MKKEKIKLTKNIVEEATNTGRRYYLWDNQLPGFGLMIQASGYKSYFLDYTNEDNRTRRIKIAKVGEVSPDDARKKAAKYRLLISQGKDPLEEKKTVENQHDELTFTDIVKLYMEKYAKIFKKPKTIIGEEGNLKNHILPVIGNKYITQIVRADIEDLHIKLKDYKHTANRCLEVISKIMNLCEDWGYRPENSNPCRGIKKYKEEARERFLNLEEIKRLQESMDTMLQQGESPYFIALIRLLLLTGARLSEVMTCRWDYINFDRKVISLPDSKTGKKEIILCDNCIEILSKLEKKKDNPYIIISSRNKSSHLGYPKKAWRRLLKLANLEENIRIHDLRHTNASISLMANIPIEIISKRLGHSNIQTTMRYAHLADESIRNATNILSQTIRAASV